MEIGYDVNELILLNIIYNLSDIYYNKYINRKRGSMYESKL